MATNTKKKLVWRLGKALQLSDVHEMLDKKVITAEEAKELLFNQTDEGEEIKALKAQVKLLEGVVEKLTERQNPQTIIKYVEGYRWPGTYYTVSTSGNSDWYGTKVLLGNVTNAVMSSAGGTSTTTFTSGGSTGRGEIIS